MGASASRAAARAAPKANAPVKPTNGASTAAEPGVTARVGGSSGPGAVPPAAGAPPARLPDGDWAALLNDMGGGITSRAWEGSVGGRGARALDPGRHASQVDAGVRARLPRRRLPPEVKVPEPQGGLEGAKEALREIEAAIGKVEDGVEERQGRLSQNLVLEVYRRERGGNGGVSGLVDDFGLAKDDAQDLLTHFRTVLPVQVMGIGQGVYDPSKGVTRFEDLEQTA